MGGAGRLSEPSVSAPGGPFCLCSCLSLLTAPQMLPQHRALPLESSPNQFSLYTSPSLPNISLGLQATVTVTNSHLTVSMGTYPVFSLMLSPLVLDVPSWSFCPPEALREIRWLTPELGGGQRVIEGCRSKIGRTGGNVRPLPHLSPLSIPGLPQTVDTAGGREAGPPVPAAGRRTDWQVHEHILYSWLPAGRGAGGRREPPRARLSAAARAAAGAGPAAEHPHRW